MAVTADDFLRECRHCGETFVRPNKPGKAPVYCSTDCRETVLRERRADYAKRTAARDQERERKAREAAHADAVKMLKAKSRRKRSRSANAGRPQ